MTIRTDSPNLSAVRKEPVHTTEKQGSPPHVDSRSSEVNTEDNEHTPQSTTPETKDKCSEPTPLTIEDLKIMTGISTAQLDKEIVEFDIFLLAGCFDRYSDYVDRLRLSPPECEDLRTEQFLYGHQSAMAKALRLWRRHDPSAATYRALVNMALELMNGEVATRLCEYIVENLTFTETTHHEPSITVATVGKTQLLQQQESFKQSVHEKDSWLHQLKQDIDRERASAKSEIQYLREQIDKIKVDLDKSAAGVEQQRQCNDEVMLNKDSQLKDQAKATASISESENTLIPKQQSSSINTEELTKLTAPQEDQTKQQDQFETEFEATKFATNTPSKQLGE